MSAFNLNLVPNLLLILETYSDDQKNDARGFCNHLKYVIVVRGRKVVFITIYLVVPICSYGTTPFKRCEGVSQVCIYKFFTNGPVSMAMLD